MTPDTAAFFILPDMPDLDTFEKALAGLKLSVAPQSGPSDFAMLDCHDQSLRKSGQILLETVGSLYLYGASAEILTQKGKARGKFRSELPDGQLKAALSEFPKLRALTCIAEGQLSRSALSVLDDLQKTQARGGILNLSTDRGGAVVIHVEPLRGYDRVFARVCSVLDALAGRETKFDALLPLLLPDVRPYEAKPKISLGKAEPAIDAATDIIHTYLSVARQNESGVVADVDTEFLHDYRVSLRRIRSVLSLLKGVFSEQQTVQLKQEFSDLMAVTGRLRDLDVYLLEKDSYFELIPPTLHGGLSEMFSRFEAERKRELARLSRRIRSAAYDQQMQRLEVLFRDNSELEPGPNAELPAFDYARTLIWKRYRKVCKLARSITPETPDEAVHDLRIHCKKLRYLMEFFSPLFDRSAFKTIIKPLKKLQDNLGLFNDCAVQQLALLSFASQRNSRTGQANTELSMAVGGLIAVLDQKQKSERDRVIANFRHFDSSEIRHLFRSLFHDAKE